MNPLQITSQNLSKESNCFEINLCHEPSILVLALLIDPPFPSQLLPLLKTIKFWFWSKAYDLHLQHFSIEQRISSGVIRELLIIAEKTIVVLDPATLVAIVP